MNHTLRSITSIIPAAALLFATGQVQAGSPGKARYRVVFERTWSGETHPQDFPLLAHFSPVIGATHDADFDPFHANGKASAGLEKLCEEGKHQPLDAEIETAIAKGTAGTLIETPDPIRSVPASAAATFEIDPAHPMVSVGAMIAPSPDWCALAADVSLLEDGAWVAKKTLVLEAWDVGTDSGAKYRAADADTQPREPIALSTVPYFAKDGKRVPVGTVTFERQ